MNLKLIIQGFIVGIGKIIPGVSGSMLAYSMGIYEKLLNAIILFFNNVKNNTKLLLNFGIGLFLAIIVFSKIILFLLNNYYALTMYLFLGLILGTLITFKKNIKYSFKNIFIIIMTLLILSLLSFKIELVSFVYVGNFGQLLYIIILGGIDAITSIVPGISGTAIYMLLGVYEFILLILANPLSLEFIFYLIGLILGIILTCYLMSYLLKYKKDQTNSFIMALMLGSIFLIFKSIYCYLNINCLLLFALGSILGMKLDK